MNRNRARIHVTPSVCALMALAIGAAGLPAPPGLAAPQGAGDGFLGPRGTFDWLAYAFLPPELWTGSIMIKIREGKTPGLKDRLIVDGKGAPLVDIAALVPEGSHFFVTQGFGIEAQKLRMLKSVGEQRCRCELADLSTYFTVTLDGSPAEPFRLLEALNAHPMVEIAYPVTNLAVVPPPVDLPPTTPDYSGSQGYMDPAPDGIDVQYARGFPGGRGEAMTVVDVEGNWRFDHEDTESCVNALIPPFRSLTLYDDPVYTEHGTAVTSMLFGGDNGYGVTGMVPDATCLASADYTIERDADVPGAILLAFDYVSTGCIFLIEAQEAGPNFDPDTYGGLVPVEWAPANYDTIRSATAAGYIIVEPAANGWEDLDDPVYLGFFDRSVRDSGAIMVGAGTPPSSRNPRSPEDYTNWGSRVDVQGWGSAVYAAGYGDLFDGGGDPRQYYTAGFGGTSSASPIVTAAVAILSSVRAAAGMEPMTAVEIRDALVATGTPQVPGPKHIGPLPDLSALLDAVMFVCGDGIVVGSEICDDGNTAGGDGCSADCLSDESCGNGVFDAAAGEVCDDGNTAPGDGCGADCRSDESCGNGVADTAVGEICDDGNTAPGDGCGADCRSDESCGNGIVDAAAGEICDDGGTADGDGCSADCRSDESCGNGIVDTVVGEVCDDGNRLPGDGCPADCLAPDSIPEGGCACAVVT